MEGVGPWDLCQPTTPNILSREIYEQCIVDENQPPCIPPHQPFLGNSMEPLQVQSYVMSRVPCHPCNSESLFCVIFWWNQWTRNWNFLEDWHQIYLNTYLDHREFPCKKILKSFQPFLRNWEINTSILCTKKNSKIFGVHIFHSPGKNAAGFMYFDNMNVSKCDNFQKTCVEDGTFGTSLFGRFQPTVGGGVKKPQNSVHVV